MKKVFNWIWLVLYCILPIYFLVVLLVSAFGSYKIDELIDTYFDIKKNKDLLKG